MKNVSKLKKNVHFHLKKDKMKKGDPTLNKVTFSINWLQQESWIWVCKESGRFEKTSLYIPKIQKT